MNVAFCCPHCEETGRVEIAAGGAALRCPSCQSALASATAERAPGSLERCLVCGSPDLFIRKDFPHRLGLSIVVLGFGLSCVTWFFYWTYLTFAILFATALLDMALFMIVGDSLVCYRCRAEYRQLASTSAHGPFSLETHERYRQQAARLAQAERLAAAAAPPAGDRAAD